MNTQELEKLRTDLEKKMKRREAAHYAKPYWHNEGSYQDSVKELRDIYAELSKVAIELGKPLPVWF